jgi:phospholipase/carboxylesterase
MLIHGDVDDVVPFEAMFLAIEALGAAQVPVQWLRRPGLGHAIDPYGLEQGGRFLGAMLKGAKNG